MGMPTLGTHLIIFRHWNDLKWNNYQSLRRKGDVVKQIVKHGKKEEMEI